MYLYLLQPFRLLMVGEYYAPNMLYWVKYVVALRATNPSLKGYNIYSVLHRITHSERNTTPSLKG